MIRMLFWDWFAAHFSFLWWRVNNFYYFGKIIIHKNVILFVKYMPRVFHCITKSCPKIEKVLWSVSKSALVMMGSTIYILVASYPDQPFTIVGVFWKSKNDLDELGRLYFRPIAAKNELKTFLIEILPMSRTYISRITSVWASTFWDLQRHWESNPFVWRHSEGRSFCFVRCPHPGNHRRVASQEILVIGISNAIACFFSSMPIGGSFFSDNSKCSEWGENSNR